MNMKNNIMMCFVVVVSVSVSYSPQPSHCRPVMPLTAAKNLNDLIESTCKQTPNYNVCVSSLRSDPRSSKATNVQELALVMVDVLKKKAQETLDRINELLKHSPKPQLKQPLVYCTLTYGAILNGDIPQATEAFTKGDYKFAEEGCADAANEAHLCETKFTPPGSSPITRTNTVVHDVASVTSSMAKMLLTSSF